MHFLTDGTSLGQMSGKAGKLTLKHLSKNPLYAILSLKHENGVFTKSGSYGVQRYSPTVAEILDHKLIVGHPTLSVCQHLVVEMTFDVALLAFLTSFITAGKVRAVDTNSSSLFVVLVESGVSGRPDTVLLYACPFPNPVHTYTPPRHLERKYRPTDVCFFTLGGVRKLLVADEGNDAVHVVDTDVNGLTLTFSHLLSTNCELRQPTALTSDTAGRLWVACKGGNIVALKEANKGRARTLANKWAERESLAASVWIL
jgi:hypothetical protein